MLRRTVRSAAAALAAAALLAGCTGGSAELAVGSGPGSRGGTLIVLGTSDLAHADPSAATRSTSAVLLRAVSRQLVSYPAADGAAGTVPVPDLAEELPVGADGRTYTVRIRVGARWNTVPQRQITAVDAIRGIQRSCYPGRPARSPVLLADVVEGLAAFCAGLARVPRKAVAVAAYLAAHEVAGLSAVDERTLRIRLTRPAADLPDLLAQPAASPVPIEALGALPGSPAADAAAVACGPYKVSRHDPDLGYTLERNPAWDAATDPVRKAWVDRIDIVLGADADVVQRRLEDGSADLAWDTTVPADRARALAAAGDARLALLPTGGLDPYLAINVASPAAKGALAVPGVRRALNAAADKAAVAALAGGPPLAEPAEQALTPPVSGYLRRAGVSPDHAGDADTARALLRTAGYPDGLRLRLVYRNAGDHPAIARALATALGEAGIELTLAPVDAGTFYDGLLSNRAATRAGRWDLALAGWGPDWFGAAGRSMLGPLVDGRRCGADSVNYACFSDNAVNRALDAALAAPSAAAAGPLWRAVDTLVTSRMPLVPLRTRAVAVYRSARVQGPGAVPFLLAYDPTNMWLADPGGS